MQPRAENQTKHSAKQQLHKNLYYLAAWSNKVTTIVTEETAIQEQIRSSHQEMPQQSFEREEHHEDSKSGVSASTESKVVCTFPTQVSKRSRREFTWSMPKTLGWTHETWTVPSTWSIMPSIRRAWRKQQCHKTTTNGGFWRAGLTERLFISRYSTSSTESLVRSAISLNGIVRFSDDRLQIHEAVSDKA